MLVEVEALPCFGWHGAGVENSSDPFRRFTYRVPCEVCVSSPACSATWGYAGMRSHWNESAFVLMTESECWIRGRYHEVNFSFYYQSHV